MTHLEIVNWLISNRPGAKWNLSGETYEGLEWLDSPETKPTAEEIGLGA
jgi:hypothetical protein